MRKPPPVTTSTSPVEVRRRKLGRHRVWGQYYGPDQVEAHSLPLIEVDERLGGPQELAILLHESLHHTFPYLSEEEVTNKATSLAAILWADGWRRETKTAQK